MRGSIARLKGKWIAEQVSCKSCVWRVNAARSMDLLMRLILEGKFGVVERQKAVDVAKWCCDICLLSSASHTTPEV